MSKETDTLKNLYKTLKITQLKLKKYEEDRKALKEGIAIVGIGCRFPGGADGPDRFWELLINGIDATTEFPPGRWDHSKYYDPDPDAPGKLYTSAGGFLEDINSFDSGFFNLSPIEVRSLDPQHRLLLEVVWESVENAGMNIKNLKGSKTGVFCGVANNDYASAHLRSGDLTKIDAYSITGIADSTLTGRISYLFGFQGPSMAVDTACSSSLVAVHLACQSLREGESDLALAGGTQLNLTPEGHIGFCKLRILSGEGKCKSFDADADGISRGEGCGVVVLKRLSDAVRDHDNILAVIKGSAVNQDGSSNGLTAPNGLAQERVIRRALDTAEIAPEEVDYIEAHGTGTQLGDPIEAESLGRIFNNGRSADNPLYVGSVKANIGHLEAAAGVAGLIKAVLIINRGAIPGQVNFNNANPKIPWDRIPLAIPKELTELRESLKTRTAGVSSFSFSGTNSHLIIQEPPADNREQAEVNRSHHILNLSAKNKEALNELAGRYGEYLEKTEDNETIGDICYSANTGRSGFHHRLCLVGESLRDMRDSLNNYLSGESDSNIALNREEKDFNKKIVFMFTGQGSQYSGMGADLYESSPLFRETMDKCDKLFEPFLDRSIVDIIYNEEFSDDLNMTVYTQPVIFSVEYALYKIWESWGVTPSVVMGHSIGEYVAACVAGIFTLEDAVKLVAVRGRLMQSLPANGAMAVIIADEETVKKSIANYKDSISIAAVNAPENVVISGESEAIVALMVTLTDLDIPSQFLQISHAIHSQLMYPIVEEFRQRASEINYATPVLPIISNETGRRGGSDMACADYWTDHIRRPVRFYETMVTLDQEGFEIFLELGATTTLMSLGMQCIPDNSGLWLYTLGMDNSFFNMRPSRIEGKSDWEQVLKSVALLYVHGVDIDWEAFNSPYGFKKTMLPNYPFQREKQWIEPVYNYFHSNGAETGSALIETQAIPEREISEKTTASDNDSELSIHGAKQRERLIDEVLSLMFDVSKIRITKEYYNTNLFQLGFVSLMITRLRESIRRKYGIEISMRSFFNKTENLNKLVDYLLENLPDQSSRSDNSVSDKLLSPAESSPKGEPSLLESTISRQMELMSKQMEIMSSQLDVLRKGDGLLPEIPLARESAENRQKEIKSETKGMGPWRSISSKGNLTSDRAIRKHLNSLIDNYTSFTGESKKLTQKYRPVFANIRNISGFRPEWKEMVYQIIADRAKGSRFHDIEGREYLDMTMGFGVYLFGHNPDFIKETLEKEVRAGYPIGPMSYRAGRVAEMICKMTGTERAAFFNTGTEAVMSAIRIARAVTGRFKIVVFSGSYHGHSDGVLAIRGMEENFEAIPFAPGTPGGMVSDVYVLEYGDNESLEFIEAKGEELAAVVVEPVQSRNPSLQPREFLVELRRITEKSATALLFDEMITGFRLCPGGAQAWAGVEADIVTYGKVIGGGIPIGVVAGKSRFLDAVDGGMWAYGDSSCPEKENTLIAGTFNHHPLAMATAEAVLTHLADKGAALQDELNSKTAGLCARLNDFFGKENIPLETAHFSSLFRFVLKGDHELLNYHLIEKGIYIWEGRSCFLSTAHSDDDIELFIQKVKESIFKMREGGLFPVKGEVPTAFTEGEGVSTDQRRIYILSRMDGGESAYHISVPFIVEGSLHIKRCEEIFRELVQRHESLRQSFAMREGDVVSTIVDSVEFHVEYKETNEEDKDSLIKEFIRPFDLSKAPLIRVCIAKISEIRFLVIIDTHHIISDGISCDILIGEFMGLYNRESLDPLPAKYGDYITMEREYLISEKFLIDEELRLAGLSGNLPLLNLPLDRPRPQVREFKGGNIYITLDRDITSKLKEVASNTGSSLYMVLLAAHYIMLHKLTGQEDMITGTNFDGRKDEKFSGIVGMFVKTLALRNGPCAAKSFSAFVNEVKMSVLDAYDSMDYPFEMLVNKLLPQRDISRNPLFDTMFVYEIVDLKPQDAGELKVEKYEYTGNRSMFDMTHEILEMNGTLSINLQYNSAIFNRDSAERFSAYYENILCDIALDHNKRISDINILPQWERKRLFTDFNNTSKYYPLHKTIVDLFEAQVNKTPDNTAIITEESTMTYRALNEGANIVAHYLRDNLNIIEGDIVGIKVDRSKWAIIGIMGILKAGGAFLPIDPLYPPDRINYMVEDSRCKAILSERKYMKEGLTAIDISEMDHHKRHNPDIPLTSSDLAYVIYTSGSTGKPKGVMVEHKSPINMALSHIDFFGINREDRFLQFSSLSSDSSLFEIFLSLFAGASVVIIDKDTIFNTEKFIAYIEERGVTVMFLPPVYLNSLNKRSLKGVRTIITGGAPAVRGDVLHYCKSKNYFNSYGPTETTVAMTYFKADPHREYGNHIPIGTPIANTSVFILDDNLTPLPTGVTGEICIAGECLARGYLNKPEMTSEKFVPHPLAEGGLIYRSGDLGRWLSDGNLECLGRKDDQVKIRSYRVELNEISHLLSEHPSIQSAVVTARRLGGETLDLIAYFIEREPVDFSDLRNYLAKSLPEYMVPGYYVRMDKFPITPNNKIDKEALPDPGEKEGSDSERVHIPPRTDQERILANIWSEVLNIKDIGIEDNFFVMGGDSIKAIQIVSRLSEVNMKVTVRQIFENPAISALAAFVTESSNNKKVNDPVTGRAPLSPIQSWFFETQLFEQNHYTQAVLLTVRGETEETALKEVLQKLQEHHDMLRARFFFDSGEIIQEIMGTDLTVDFDVLDFRGKDNPEVEILKHSATLPGLLNIKHGPLMKSVLFRSDKKDFLVIVIHHLVIDGVSWRILIEDLNSAYNQYMKGNPLILPFKGESFKSLSEILADYANRDELLDEKSYWNYIDTVKVKPLPVDFESKTNFHGDFDTLTAILSEKETTDLLKNTNSAYHTETRDILMTALARTLKAWTGENVTLIDLEGHGRENMFSDRDVSGTVGWFTSVYPVLLLLPVSEDEGQQINYIRDSLKRIPNNGAGYGILRYLTSSENKRDISLNRNPVLGFNYLGEFQSMPGDRTFEYAGKAVPNTIGHRIINSHYIDIDIIIVKGRLEIHVHYNTTLYKMETMERFPDMYRKELTVLIKHCIGKINGTFILPELTYKSLGADRLSALLEREGIEKSNVKDIYTLSPMQEGMLFHKIYDRESTAYFEQVTFTAEGRLDIEAFKKSWKELLKLYDIFRTLFIHKETEEPLQIVLKERDLDFTFMDLSDLTDKIRKDVINKFRQQDRERGFDLAKDVLIRVAVLKVSESTFVVVWSHHHIIMDGWCLGIVIKKLFTAYSAYITGEKPPSVNVPQYGKYIARLKNMDREETKRYWEEYLSEYDHSITVTGKQKQESRVEEYKVELISLELNEEITKELRHMAVKNRVSLNTVIQAAWATLLCKYNGTDDIVFGATVSGRPVDVQGVGDMVGLFINTVPVRVRFKGDAGFEEVMSRLQNEAFDSERHHYYSLADIQSQSPLKQDLIEHVVVFENYPLSGELHKLHEEFDTGFTVKNIDVVERTNYDFILIVYPAERIVFNLSYNSSAYSGEEMEKVKNDLAVVFESLIQSTEKRIDEIRESLMSDDEKREHENFLMAMDNIGEDF